MAAYVTRLGVLKNAIPAPPLNVLLFTLRLLSHYIKLRGTRKMCKICSGDCLKNDHCKTGKEMDG